jgi:uncharacterized protein YbjT (DUF2867 family)
MGRRALIAGATGLTGSRLLALLLARPEYGRVHAVLRRPLPEAQRPADPAAAARLVVHVADLARPAAELDLPAVDDVYLCLGTTIRAAGSREAFRSVDFDATVRIARLARRRGAGRCAVVSALGADASSRVFYPRIKGETEAALATLGYPSLTVLRPSLIDGERAELRPGERMALALARPASALLPARWRPVPADAIARCLLASVLRGQPGLRVIESDRIARAAG